MAQTLRQAISVCQPEVQREIERLPQSMAERIEELRFRIGQPITCICGDKLLTLHCPPPTSSDLESMLGRATGQALYSAKEMLKKGFVTLPGGHRMGICGTGIYQNGELTGLREFSSLNLRIAKPLTGVADSVMGALWTHPCSTLIIGPPGRGKTTLLRDMIRQASDRYLWRICVADERMELAAALNGRPQFSLGTHTDVLSGVKKSAAISMLMRSMNPRWIAVDEITEEEDVEAMLAASYCGVSFLATAHAACRGELDRRPIYVKLMEARVFSNLITILPDRKLRFERLEYNA